MNKGRMGKVAIGLVGCLVVAGESSAESWRCQQNDLIREVTIYYPNEPACLPCEVFYTKRQEDTLPQSLWAATNEEGYCERKAEAFIEKLRSMGWQCAVDSESTAKLD